MRFAALDWVVVGAYFAVLLGIAAWVARRRQQTAADYFLAGRHVGWFAIGASLFASNIGSEHLVGLAGTGAEQRPRPRPVRAPGSSLILLILGWLFVPFYVQAAASSRCPSSWSAATTPAARWYLSVIMLVIGYVLTKISVTDLRGRRRSSQDPDGHQLLDGGGGWWSSSSRGSTPSSAASAPSSTPRLLQAVRPDRRRLGTP